MATTTMKTATTVRMTTPKMSHVMSTVDSLFYLAVGVIVIGSIAGFFLR
jgi:hypothetical protein